MHMITSYHLWSFGIIWAPRELGFDFDWSGESDGDGSVLPSLSVASLFHDSAARFTCHPFGQKLSCFSLINECASSGFPVGFCQSYCHRHLLFLFLFFLSCKNKTDLHTLQCLNALKTSESLIFLEGGKPLTLNL